MLISLEQVKKSFGAQTILEEVTAAIEDEDRIGLIGVNGAGKSTLLNLIVGDLECDEGVISRLNGLTIGFLRQNSGLERSSTIDREMHEVFRDLLDQKAEMERLEQALSALPEEAEEARNRLTDQYARLQTDFEQREGYLIDVKINAILNGMGFQDYDRGQCIENLSGGEKTRLAMARLLLEEPKLLILDEPTNHLDFRTLTWLEEYLSSYRGALLVVSHDRYFLDKLVGKIWEVENHHLLTYPGNYSKYVLLRQERREAQRKRYEAQQQEIAAIQDFVARNIVRATTTKRAQSRRNALERMEILEKPTAEARPPKLRFSYDREPVLDVLQVEDLQLYVGEGDQYKQLAAHIDLSIRRGEKIALIGANGVGKSTLLKAIQRLIPSRYRFLQWGRNVRIGYYEQENRQLHPEKTALDELWDRFPNAYEQDIRGALGAVLLSGEAVKKQVKVLSGGERAKLAFAILMLERGNVLLMDEPTNHLDINSKEALDDSLQEFTGTVLLVSHDRYLLNKVPTKIIEMFPDHLEVYEGNYDYYMEKRRTPPVAPIREEKAPSVQQTNFYRSKKQRSQMVSLKKHLAEQEQLVNHLEQEIEDLQEKLTLPEFCSDYEKLTEATRELEQKQHQLEGEMDRWLQLNEELEQFTDAQ